MKTLNEVLDILEQRIDQETVEDYIARAWLHPVLGESGWSFEDIDIARLQLVCDLTQDMNVNDEGTDVALHLLDQLYGLRVHMQKITHAIQQQPPQVKTDIMMVIQSFPNHGSL